MRSEHLGHGARGPAFGVHVDVGVDIHRGLAVVATCQLAVAPHPSADPTSHGDDGGVTARECHNRLNSITDIIKGDVLCVLKFAAVLLPQFAERIAFTDLFHNLRVVRQDHATVTLLRCPFQRPPQRRFSFEPIVLHDELRRDMLLCCLVLDKGLQLRRPRELAWVGGCIDAPVG